MSQENVEVVRRFVDHLNATGDALWEALDPEVEWVVDPLGLLAGTYRGHEGVRSFIGQFRESFDRVQIDLDETIDAGDFVVALGRIRSHGKGSGVTAEQPAGWVYRVREGLILGWRVYFRPTEALEAVGLSE
jgi:ketosteroid isomerase-like protein